MSEYCSECGHEHPFVAGACVMFLKRELDALRADLEAAGIRGGVCRECGSAVLRGEHLRDDLAPCMGRSLRDQLAALRAERDKERAMIDYLVAQVKRAEAERDRYRAALERMADHGSYFNNPYGERARAALNGGDDE